jgi:hypothetical protein
MLAGLSAIAHVLLSWIEGVADAVAEEVEAEECEGESGAGPGDEPPSGWIGLRASTPWEARFPQLGRGSWMPRPRKERKDSERMALGTVRVP